MEVMKFFFRVAEYEEIRASWARRCHSSRWASRWSGDLNSNDVRRWYWICSTRPWVSWHSWVLGVEVSQDFLNINWASRNHDSEVFKIFNWDSQNHDSEVFKILWIFNWDIQNHNILNIPQRYSTEIFNDSEVFKILWIFNWDIQLRYSKYCEYSATIWKTWQRSCNEVYENCSGSYILFIRTRRSPFGLDGVNAVP